MRRCVNERLGPSTPAAQSDQMPAVPQEVRASKPKNKPMSLVHDHKELGLKFLGKLSQGKRSEEPRKMPAAESRLILVVDAVLAFWAVRGQVLDFNGMGVDSDV